MQLKVFYELVWAELSVREGRVNAEIQRLDQCITQSNSFAIATAAAAAAAGAVGACFSFDLDLNIYKGKKAEAGHECIFSFAQASHETNDIQ